MEADETAYVETRETMLTIAALYERLAETLDGVIDLLLTDLVMPKGQPSGLALGRMARMKRLGIKVAFISGYDIDGSSLPGKLFRKPLDFDHLVAEVGALLAT